MFNNSVLDVAIGLIFIYLLYSLLATTIKEFIATIFTYRGRMLERGIEQLLDGENYSYYWWNKLFNWFVGLFGKPPGQNSKFSKKARLLTAKVTQHPLYKRSSEDSLLNKKPAYIPSDVFSDILIDLFSPQSGAPILLKDIASTITQKANDPAYPLNYETARILNLYINQANGDLQRFKSLVENWYADMMDRVSGWYKKQANKILLVIGLILAILFNVSTVEIVRKLSTDKTAREALIKDASDYIKTHSKELDESKGNKIIASGKSPQIDTALTNVKQVISKITKLYNDSIAKENTTLGLGWGDFGYKEDSAEYAKTHNGGKLLPKSFSEKIGYVIVGKGPGEKWIGFLLTGLAISLGAPFWFDLLNKFINLRASGKKPGDSNPGSSKTPALNQKPLPNSFA